MEWIVQPFKAFGSLDAVAADTCSGGGELRHCDCTGGLVICGPTPNSFVIKPKEKVTS